MPALPRVTYANVVATLALVVALGGTSYAAVALPRNSVGSVQLKAGAVAAADLRKNAVTPAKLSPAARALAAAGPVSPAVASGAVTDLPSIGPGITAYRRGSIQGASADVIDPGSVQTLSPAVATRARALSVRTIGDVPLGGSVLLELVAQPEFGDGGGAPALLSCTITGTTGVDKTCRASGSAVIPASTVVYMRVSVAGGASEATNVFSVAYGMTLEPVR